MTLFLQSESTSSRRDDIQRGHHMKTKGIHVFNSLFIRHTSVVKYSA